jgi:hypothetical protein
MLGEIKQIGHPCGITAMHQAFNLRFANAKPLPLRRFGFEEIGSTFAKKQHADDP